MPELPDLEVYIRCLAARIVGHPLQTVRLLRPFVLRSVTPPVTAAHGRTVAGIARLGKRLVVDLGDELFLVVHLMIAGRLRWRDRDQALDSASPRTTAPIPRKLGLAAFDFATGTLLLTEAGSIKRASLHVVAGRRELAAHDRGGVEPLAADRAAFARVLTSENHTLKRALTDPRLFAGIGNAYSDEILHAAGLSPLKLTRRLAEDEVTRLHAATRTTLRAWIERLARQAGDGFPEKVTAFRPEMAVHGRYRQPCPACGLPVQRIVYATNEVNYCAGCQTGGKLLADRALSRLLKRDWPSTLDEADRR